jgi:hypothetical protein
MDSASPIAQRITGEYDASSGSRFTFAMWTETAENTLKRFRNGHDRPGGYRHHHRRSYGEGPLA